ncbi:MAG: HAMP domain-containing protein [Acidobacteria bacterium]|nr:HAMP domain-containing protein [Acidobacteriota bacterium]
MLSLRRRLILWHAAVFAAGLLAFAFVVWLGSRQILDAELERWLSTQADGLDRFLHLELRGTNEAAILEEAREFSTGLPRGSGMLLYRADGTLLLARPSVLPAPEGGSRSGHVLVDGLRARAIRRSTVVEGQRMDFVLWRSTAESDATLWKLARLLASLSPVFLALAILGGWWLSRRTLQPVDDLTRAARGMSLSRLSERLLVPESKDELYRLCIAWNEMLARLEESANRLQQFTADASHELRTPVAVIRAAAELALRQEREPEAYRQALRSIKEQSLEMSQLVDNLLSLARAEEQQLRASFLPVDLRDVVRDVESNARPGAEASGLQLTVALPDKPATIHGDRASLRRLLNLLLDNAFKFTPAPGHIQVCVGARPDESVVLEVTDTGIGIGQEHLPKIFDRFFQADPSRSAPGAGLGLSLARWITDTHQATWEVASAPGQGSHFRVVFRPAPAGLP